MCTIFVFSVIGREVNNMSDISGSTNTLRALQEFNTKISALVDRKRKAEISRSESLAEARAVNAELANKYRAERQDQLAAKMNQLARLERLKAARLFNQLVGEKNQKSVNRNLITGDNALYKQGVSLQGKSESQRVVDNLDLQKRESMYFSRLANDLLDQQIFDIKLNHKRLEEKLIDENIESDAVQNDILEYKNQESKMIEDLVEQKSQEADQIYSAKHNDTPSLQLKKRIEKLVEMQEEESDGKDGISMEI